MKFLLEENAKSLTEVKYVLTSSHPHFVTRRYAELACSIYNLRKPVLEKGKPDEVLVSALQFLQTGIVGFLQSLSPLKERRVFLINNFDLILTIFYERNVRCDITTAFEDLLKQQVNGYIEAQLHSLYKELILFVQRKETGEACEEAFPIAKHFNETYKINMSTLHNNVMNNFVNFNNGMEILKQALTQLLLYYTRFQKCTQKMGSNTKIQNVLISNTVILQEIKKYSAGFGNS